MFGEVIFLIMGNKKGKPIWTSLFILELNSQELVLTINVPPNATVSVSCFVTVQTL